MPSGLGPWVGALLATTQLSARRVGESGRRLVACGSSWRCPPIVVGGGARRTVGSSLARAPRGGSPSCGVRVGGRGWPCTPHGDLGFAAEVARPLQHLTTSLELARTRGIRLFN